VGLDRRLFAIYLDDHRAGAAAGQALARRAAQRYGHTPAYAELVGLRDDIEADVEGFDELRERLGLDGGRLKRALALLGERFGRLKPNGRLVRRSPLSRVLELELLSAGVAAKRRLWYGVMAACGSEELAGVDLRGLVERADDQLERLHRLHQRAAASIERAPSNAA
jgi:hypothetical protein